MKTFNDREKDVIRRLMQAGGDSQTVLMHELLKTFYFREEYGRALIVQNQGEYAVFFLKPELFDDREKRDSEVKRFFELISLLNYLNRKGYITVYRHVTEKMYFVQDGFDAPKVINNQLLLNTKGYFSSSPDTVRDTNKSLVFSGIIIRDDHYRLILSVAVGTLLISGTLGDLLQDSGNLKKQRYEKRLGYPAQAGKVQKGDAAPIFCFSDFDLRRFARLVVLALYRNGKTCAKLVASFRKLPVVSGQYLCGNHKGGGTAAHTADRGRKTVLRHRHFKIQPRHRVRDYPARQHYVRHLQGDGRRYLYRPLFQQ
jgi:hypothetical protein